MWLHLNYEFYLFKENHKNIYGDLISNDASVLTTNFEFTSKKDSFKGVVITIFIKVNLKSFTITQILLTLSLDILYKSQLTNLNEEAAIKYGNSHLEIFYNTGSIDLTRNWPRTSFSNFITCSESQKRNSECQRFHHKEKISQVLSKFQSQYFIQCHIAISFIETVLQVSFITEIQTVMSLFWNHFRFYYKNSRIVKVAEFLEKSGSTYFRNSWGDAKKLVRNAKYEITYVKIIFD